MPDVLHGVGVLYYGQQHHDYTQHGRQDYNMYRNQLQQHVLVLD
jgi:hypothetical protein